MPEYAKSPSPVVGRVSAPNGPSRTAAFRSLMNESVI
jgi:hypothetical protein